MYGIAPARGRLWWQREVYRPGSRSPVFDIGEIRVGLAVSATFVGESVVDVMNAMAYRAAVSADHGLGRWVIPPRRRKAQLSFLDARTVKGGTGRRPDYVLCFVQMDVRRACLGELDLASVETPEDTPTHLARPAEPEFCLHAEADLRDALELRVVKETGSLYLGTWAKPRWPLARWWGSGYGAVKWRRGRERGDSDEP